jgi:hypothetical protein
MKSSRDFELNGFSLRLSQSYFHKDKWFPMKYSDGDRWRSIAEHDLTVYLKLKQAANCFEYDLSVESEFETQIRLKLSLMNEMDLFHLIPCNIHGDNNFSKVRPGEFPLLTMEREKDIECSPFWEFRADRSSHPVSMLCCDRGTVGVTIEPYAYDTQGQLIRNGIFSELPNSFGVSLGYTNYPITYINHMFGPEGKIDYSESTYSRAKVMRTRGKIYCIRGKGRLAAHQIIHSIYDDLRETPKPRKSYQQAVKGLLDALLTVNWSDELQNYTNASCKVPDEPELKPWRPLVEIGWTGGGVIAFSLLMAQCALDLPNSIFDGRKSPFQVMDEIIAGYNPNSGLFYDVIKPWSDKWPESRVNGWWSGFHLVEDCHSAYTNGSATFYLFKMLEFLGKSQRQYNQAWLKTGLKVLDTVIDLQRKDGAFGYTFSQHEKKVLDWGGFAGCWFAGSCALAYRLTEKACYLNSADKALDYYKTFVEQLNCWGTPMDTYKAVDQEGNLAFIRTARTLHETTRNKKYLDLLKIGADYECLWRYGFKAKPEYPPLKDSGWNSCGGSITSISNPHIHPMGLLVTSDLEYLAEQISDSYYHMRAQDGINWIMATMELYPDIMGYGCYGVLSERTCPSDGLTTERYSDGTPASTWFSYNGWAAANALEALAEKILHQ